MHQLDATITAVVGHNHSATRQMVDTWKWFTIPLDFPLSAPLLLVESCIPFLLATFHPSVSLSLLYYPNHAHCFTYHISTWHMVSYAKRTLFSYQFSNRALALSSSLRPYYYIYITINLQCAD